MHSYSKFIFSGYRTELKEGKITFSYKLVGDNGEEEFSEILKFTPVEANMNENVLNPLLDSLLLVLGISYWKLYCPKKLETPTISLSQEQAEFWNTIYTKGLGEFYYKNKIDFRGLVSFPSSEAVLAQPVSFPRKNRSLVGIGGGKDSIVTAEILKKSNKDFTGFILNPHPLQESVVQLLEINSLSITRELDQKLFEFNKREDAYNGHVPISTIYAFIAVLAAILYDYRYIVVSNEKSANYGNVEYLGESINHQWSKSEEFENLFQSYISKYITSDIIYFSLLRPFYELKITELFTKYPQYFNAFSSCNTNFKKENENKEKLWCGKCPKCAFVFSQLSAFLSKDKVMKIFGKNLYEDESLLSTYRELLGIKDAKPFDCVGIPDEVKVAFYKAHLKGEYENDAIMKIFIEEVLPHMNNIEVLEKELLEVGDTSNLPGEFKDSIKAV